MQFKHNFIFFFEKKVWKQETKSHHIKLVWGVAENSLHAASLFYYIQHKYVNVSIHRMIILNAAPP